MLGQPPARCRRAQVDAVTTAEAHGRSESDENNIVRTYDRILELAVWVEQTVAVNEEPKTLGAKWAFEAVVSSLKTAAFILGRIRMGDYK